MHQGLSQLAGVCSSHCLETSSSRLTCLVCLLQVKAAAASAGTATFKLVGNRDIEHILDDLLHCVARPAEVPDVVTKLSATTFVQVSATHNCTHMP